MEKESLKKHRGIKKAFRLSSRFKLRRLSRSGFKLPGNYCVVERARNPQSVSKPNSYHESYQSTDTP